MIMFWFTGVARFSFTIPLPLKLCIPDVEIHDDKINIGNWLMTGPVCLGAVGPYWAPKTVPPAHFAQSSKKNNQCWNTPTVLGLLCQLVCDVLSWSGLNQILASWTTPRTQDWVKMQEAPRGSYHFSFCCALNVHTTKQIWNESNSITEGHLPANPVGNPLLDLECFVHKIQLV